MCHNGTLCISKISQLSNKTDTDWPFRFIAQGLDVRLSMVSKAVVSYVDVFTSVGLHAFIITLPSEAYT